MARRRAPLPRNQAWWVCTPRAESVHLATQADGTPRTSYCGTLAQWVVSRADDATIMERYCRRCLGQYASTYHHTGPNVLANQMIAKRFN